MNKGADKQTRTTIKIASIQMNSGNGNKADNIEHARKLIAEAKGADVIVLPEI